jgi:hypothetical protein
MMSVAGALIGWALSDWKGNAKRMLLLKLLDAQQGQSIQDEKTA